MKLVNPDYLGFSLDYKFKGIELGCKDFKDLYSGCVYVKTGCFGCKHLSITRYDGIECAKNHKPRIMTVRKDEDDNIVENCPTFSSRLGRYGQDGCRNCGSSYYGSNRTKCRHKFTVRDELVRG